MAFCSNCGKELTANAKFCINCGTAVGTIGGQSNSRKIINDGDIHKCPNCGELLNSFVINCPSCGYELRNTTSVSAIRDFANKIDLADSDDQRVRLIRNFTIPNTKEDIIEFVILAATNAASDNVTQEIADAWLVKLEQCYHKANILLVNDPGFNKIQNIYDQTIKKCKSKKHKKAVPPLQKSKQAKPVAPRPNIVYPFLCAIPKCLGMIAGIVAFCVAISIDQSGENGVGYELVGGILLVISSFMLGRKNVGYIEIVFGAISGVLSFVLANQLQNGAFLQLVGFVVLVIVTINYFRVLVRNKKK